MLAVVVATIFNLWWIERLIKRTTAGQVEREEQLKKWLFDSLYSINNKVLLPDEVEKKVVSRPARVYCPATDPLSEFNGNQDDELHQ